MTDPKLSSSAAAHSRVPANRSPDADIADESAADQNIADQGDAGDEVAEGKWKSTDDGSGTSETD